MSGVLNIKAFIFYDEKQKKPNQRTIKRTKI